MTSEQKAVLSIINAYKFDGTKKQVPWHITELGWKTYVSHSVKEIRDAALKHPNCPSELKPARQQCDSAA